MKYYHLRYLLGMVIFLLFPVSCNQFDEGHDELTMVTVDVNINSRNSVNDSFQTGAQNPKFALDSSVKTVVILAVPGSASSSSIDLGMEHYDKQLMTLSSGKVTLLVPLYKSLRLVQLAYSSTYTISDFSSTQLISKSTSQEPSDSYRGISDSFSLTADDSSKTVTIDLAAGPGGWIGTQLIGSTAKDDVHGMAIDSNNYLYLAGHTSGDMAGLTNSGTEDIVLLKYNSGGVIKGVVYYTETGGSLGAYGTDIAVDGSGNLYITGHTDGTGFYGESWGGPLSHFLLKTSSSGAPTWAKIIGVSQMNEHQRVAVDSSNFVSTVYSESGVIRYSSVGAIQGTGALVANQSFDSATGIATGSSNNIYITSWESSGGNRYITKHNTSATETQTSGAILNPWPGDITVDKSGNIIVVGYIDNTYLPLNGENCTGGSGELYIQKFAPTSFITPTWTRLLCTTAFDEALDVKTDSAENVFVVGLTAGAFPGETTAGLDDIVVAKFNSAGTLQWLDQFGGDGYDYADAIELDSYGYIYLAGYTDSTTFGSVTNTGSFDIFLMKYTPDGVLME